MWQQATRNGASKMNVGFHTPDAVIRMKPNVIEPGQDDEALLRALEQSGSEAALAELLRRHRDLVLGVALRRTGDHGRAEEVAQNVFMALAAKASRLSARPSLAAWFYRATFLECSEIMRGERSRKRTMDSFSKQALIDAEGQNVWREALLVLGSGRSPPVLAGRRSAHDPAPLF